MKLLSFVGAASLATSAFAAPINFTYSGTASGSLDGVAFGPTSFSIYATADTADRQTTAVGYRIVHSSVTISLNNVGSFDVSTVTSTAVNNSNSLVVFGNYGANRALLLGVGNAYGSWDLASNLGPISGGFSALQWADNGLDTSGGHLIFDDATYDGSFEASVPAPATLALVPGTLLAFRRRRN